MRYRLKKKISDTCLNTMSEKELSRIIIHLNDGQGDISSYTMMSARELLMECESERISDGSTGPAYNPNMSNSELVENFYKGLDLNGNETSAVYFDDEKGYLDIDWDWHWMI